MARRIKTERQPAPVVTTTTPHHTEDMPLTLTSRQSSTTAGASRHPPSDSADPASLNEVSSGHTTIPDEDIQMGGTVPCDINSVGATEIIDQIAGSTPSCSAVTPPEVTMNTNEISAPTASNGLEILGHKVKELIRRINKLDHLGIDTTLLSIPKIVVIGDQSAGKSSLIEAISEIKVPRNAGTCTRCPIQITLTAAETRDWSCTVTLDKKFDSTGDHFHPWVKRDAIESTLFKKTEDRNELEELLIRAQNAILNPLDDPRRHLTGILIDAERTGTYFSPNVVRLDIQGPGLPDLSFFDLPGVINQAGREDQQWLVNVVKGLAKDYVKETNAIVLLAIEMSSDPHVSSASGIMRDAKAQDRCIGVLTKPDVRGSGLSPDLLQKMFEGSAFELGHSYYVTKQPNQQALNNGITHAQARVDEDNYFATTQPWCGDLSAFNNRYGTRCIQERLSILLQDQIVACVPEFIGRVTERLQTVEDELKHFPDPPQHPLRTVLDCVSNFANAVKEYVEGEHPRHEFRQDHRGLSKRFGETLADMRPKAVLGTPGFVKPPLEIDDSENDEAGTPCPKPSLTPASKKRKGPSSSRIQLAPTAAPQRASRTTMATPIAAPAALSKHAMNLKDIRNAIEEVAVSGIPREINTKVIDRLRLTALGDWASASGPVHQFLSVTARIFRSLFETVLGHELAARRSTLLFREIDRILNEFLSGKMNEQRNVAQRALALEMTRPFTMMDHVITREIENEASALRTNRLKTRASEYFDTQEAETGKILSEPERKKRMQAMANNPKDQLNTEIGQDEYVREIEVISKVLGYYNLASMRLRDHVIQCLELDLFEACRTKLKDILLEGLNVNAGDERCATLLAEDPGTEARRLALVAERDKLLEAQRELADMSRMVTAQEMGV
ncbi:hypothetical protein LTR66_001254 [Elasticomyces elasticus]|nr:hypothetical protein LTR66_001254 [Elasticomyces elasticus]